MKPSGINNKYFVTFRSLRTDKKQIETLKQGDIPILENKRENILSSLHNLSSNAERANIEFLLDIAQNLEYGQNGNSEFREIIDETTETTTPRENTDWSKILSETIKAALNNAKEDVSDLEETYQRLFSTRRPLTPIQQEVLDLRQQLREKIITEDSLNDTDTLNTIAEISKDIDYFISSSEIPMSQKKECLEKFLYFLSDEYRIDPQLKDKKKQVIAEMLNDMLIKTPNEDALRIKTVDQLYSGICAAISICRKAIAYEDKVRYMDVIFEELKDSSTMEVYDITDLSSGKKITVPKIKIDYNTALERGYRIIDASAHIWMNNGHISGDGNLITESYTAFDNENFGVFDDSCWYEGLNPNFSAEKTLLKSLIKEKEILEDVLKYRHKSKIAGKQILEEKNKVIDYLSSINGKLSEILSAIFSEKSDSEIRALISDLIKFYIGTQSDNEKNISDKMPKELKQKVLMDHIKERTSLTKDQEGLLAESIEKIESYINLYTSAENDIKKLQNYNSKTGLYAYYRKLYNLAAAHRLSIESDVNLHDGVVRFERLSGLAPRDKQIISYLKNINSAISSSEAVRTKFMSKNSSSKSVEQLQKELLSDILKIEIIIPKQLDSISQGLFGINTAEFAARLFSETAKSIQNKEPDILERTSRIFGINNDKTKVLEFIRKWEEKLSNNPTDEDIQEAVRILGFEDRIKMIQFFAVSFFETLKEGINEEQFNELKKRFGGEDKIAQNIDAQREKFVSLINLYNEIINKWEVPSSRELILQNLEKTKLILPRKQLRVLQKRFDSIRKQVLENESIKNIKDREKANRELYTFTKEEKDILNSIENSLPDIKKYCKTAYPEINKLLQEFLEEQYSALGMLNGQFWVGEEGSTGLTTNEELRIIEQITGKPYHIQTDAEEAAKTIKEGNGGGIISYSVDDKDYAFHAQYATSVTQESIFNPKTNKKEIQDILWTDNSWGNSEKEYYWNGQNGFEYTDYGRGFGWKNGFILSKDMKIGQSILDIKDAIGVDPENQENFPLVIGTVLPGMPDNAYQKLYKMFEYIISMKKGEELYQNLEDAIKNGKKLDINFLEGIDDIAEKRVNDLTRRIKQISSEEEYENLDDNDYLKFIMELLSWHIAIIDERLSEYILTARNLEDLDELTDEVIQEYTDEMGAIICKTDIAIDKMASNCFSYISEVFKEMQKKFGICFEEQQIKEIIDKIIYNKEKLEALNGSLNEFEKYIMQQIIDVANSTFENEEQVQFFIKKVQDIVREIIDNELRINSLDSNILVKSPLHKEFIDAIDKYLKPSSDKELLMLLQAFQNADFETANEFFDNLNPEDLGICVKPPYEYIKKIQADESKTTKVLFDVVASNVISSFLDSEMIFTKKEEKASEENIDSIIDTNDNEADKIPETPEDIYRNLYVKLADLDVQTYIRNFKAEAFSKYKVRQAFPEPVILPDEEIANKVIEMLNNAEEKVLNIKSNDFMIKIFDLYEYIMHKYSNTNLFRNILNRKDVKVESNEDLKELNRFKECLNGLMILTSMDPSLNALTESIKNVLSLLPTKAGQIDGKNAGKYLNEIIKFFESWESSSINRETFVNLKETELAELKEYISVMINANVTPGYRNEALEKMKNIISLMRKDASQDELDYLKNDLIDLIVKRHIIKTPIMLLRECVKLLQNGQENSVEYKAIKKYLLDALVIAQQTRVQYKLVQNAHEGISSKIKELLPKFQVKLEDGTSEEMDSEIGILYLIQQLKNESDNHKTLNLFLNQSGLSRQALSAIINNFKIEETLKFADEKYENIIEEIKQLSKLSSIIQEFFTKSRIKHTSFSSAIDQLISYIERKSKNKESEIFKIYISYLKSIKSTKELKNTVSNMIPSLLIAGNQDGLSHISDRINQKIDTIVDLGELLEERFELFRIISVPENSEESRKKDEFNKKYEEAMEYLHNKIKSIKDFITQTDFVYL